MVANKKKSALIGILTLMSFIFGCILSSKKNYNALTKLLHQSEDSLIQKILVNKDIHEIQILYTQIHRDKEGNPSFKEFSFQENPERYFYPASTVKFPVAILALEKIRKLQRQGIEISPLSPFEIFDENQKNLAVSDTTHPDGKLTISHLIKNLISC